MSNGLESVVNYMIPAVGSPRGYFWSGVLSATPVTIDFRNVSGGEIDGQPFRPSGVFIDNTQGTGTLTIVVNEISYQMVCAQGELLNLQFPAPVDLTVTFSGSGQATIAFVDFPVLPYRNLAATLASVAWGSITGTLSAQTDLQTALNAKLTDPGANGVVVRTSSGTTTARTITGTANEVVVSNGDGVSGNPTLSVGTFLSALAALATTGLMARTGAGVVSARTITGTANNITVANGDGVSGNPTLSIPNAVTLVTPTVTGLMDCTGGQIKFPATQVPSSDANTLDDYEEGSWTPTLTFATPGDLSVTYTTRVGTYTKIGRQVVLNCSIVTSAFTFTTASGNLTITGNPFVISSSLEATGTLSWGGITKATYSEIKPVISPSAASVTFTASGSAVARSKVVATDTPTGGSIVLNLTISYNV